jgi:hypothetical protein
MMIDGVYNSCNRWCERCPFTARCGLIAYEREEVTKEKTVPLPGAFPAISGSFSSFLRRLERVLQNHRSSLSVIGYGAGDQRPRPAGMSLAALQQLSMTMMMGRTQLEKATWLEPFGRAPDYTRAEVQATQCLFWYLMMVGPKFRRATRELGADDFIAASNAKTGKLTHLVLTRLIAAITILLEIHGRAAYDDLRTTLEDSLRLLAGLRALQPDAYLAHLPGFDDPGEREYLASFYQGKAPVDPFEDGTWSPGGRAPEA